MLEVCIASVDDAVAATAGGADRLELNVALELGGLTPSLALLHQVLQTTTLPVIVMSRPRAAGFCYTARELDLVCEDAMLLLEHGAAGVASGALLSDGTIDHLFWSRLVEVVGDREIVFHRAFDLLADQLSAIDQLIDLGTTRVLTSGGRPTALEGAAQIAKLVEAAQGRLEILAGAGIRPENIGEIATQTGCRQLHGSFSEQAIDSAGPIGQEFYPRTSLSLVAAAREALEGV